MNDVEFVVCIWLDDEMIFNMLSIGESKKALMQERLNYLFVFKAHNCWQAILMKVLGLAPKDDELS